MDRMELLDTLHDIRRRLEEVFSDETTAGQRAAGSPPSTGHCAVVAMLVRAMLGGGYVSAIVNGASHWFNRIPLNGELLDVDLTGDQFGEYPVLVSRAGHLWSGSRVRPASDLNDETRTRYDLLSSRFDAADAITRAKKAGA